MTDALMKTCPSVSPWLILCRSPELAKYRNDHRALTLLGI